MTEKQNIETQESTSPAQDAGTAVPIRRTGVSGRTLLQYFFAVVLLALLQAPRLADTLEDYAGDVPLAGDAARILRTVAETTGLDSAGERVSTFMHQCSPELFLGAVEEGSADEAALAVAERSVSSPEPGPNATETVSNDTTALLPSANSTQVLPASNATTALATTNQTEGLFTANGTSLPTVNGTAGRPAANGTAELAATNGTASLAANNGTNGTMGTMSLPATNSTAGIAAANATVPHDKPLVLLIGDSMMMEGLGPALLRSLRGRDDIVVVREAKYSTGLSRMDYFDWPAYMATLVEKYTPDVVIITMGGNDAQDIIDSSKKRHFVGTESWEQQYRERATMLLADAQKDGAKVIWVGLPIMGYPTHAKYSIQLCNQQKAACTNSTSQVFVDTLSTLADDKGEFMAFVTGSDGKQTRIRYKDKIHVTTAGGEMLITEVLPQLDALLQPLLPQTPALPATNSTAPGAAAGITPLPISNATVKQPQTNATVTVQPQTNATVKAAMAEKTIPTSNGTITTSAVPSAQAKVNGTLPTAIKNSTQSTAPKTTKAPVAPKKPKRPAAAQAQKGGR